MEKLGAIWRNSNVDFKKFLGSHIIQTIAKRAWGAIEKLLFAKAKRVRFKKKGQHFSFEAKNNQTFLRIKENEKGPFVEVNKRAYALKINHESPYHKHALKHRVKYPRILKRNIGNKTRYFCQLVLEGTPLKDSLKEFKVQQRVKSLLGKDFFYRKSLVPDAYRDVVAYDVGPRMIAVSTATHNFERPIAPGIIVKAKQKRLLQRKADRSKRKNNPNNYHKNGKCKKGKKTWNNSKKHKSLMNQVAQMERKRAAQRKTEQGTLANEMISMGNVVKTENVSIKSFQRNYGKSVGNHAPASLLDMLTRKAENARGRVEKINCFHTKLSQTCLCGHIQKKELSERAHRCEVCGLGKEQKLGRDLFSAYLAIFTKNETVKIGKVEKVTSELNLEEARSGIKRHVDLSSLRHTPYLSPAKERQIGTVLPELRGAASP